MRKRSAGGLFSKTREAILAATLMAPERWWYLSDLARQLGTTPSALQRELDRLVAAGVLRRRKDGNRVYFQANTECPFFNELRGLMIKTAGLVDLLKDALRPFTGRLRAAFVYGSFAETAEHAASDVDVMVIGDVKLSEIAPALRRVEREIDRPVNPCLYTPVELAGRKAEGNHFVHTVLEGKKVFVIGSEHDLEQAP